jgi:alcohol dehydrogenase class IV
MSQSVSGTAGGAAATPASAAREFRVPSLVLSGRGASAALAPAMRDRGYRHAFVITDAGVRDSPFAPGVLDGLRRAGLRVTVHDQIKSEPTVRMIEAALADFRASGADAVVGLGGGSPMDSAKAVAILAGSTDALPAFEGADKVPPRTTPLICIATTAGTGSEVTRYLVATDEARDRKMLVSSWYVLPDVAVVDPDLTLTLPATYTVSTGIDALTHAIEAYVSKRVQPLSEPLALSAISRIGRSLRTAYAEPDNVDAREQMALAALEAGIAFCNASVALVHGMARPLGAHFNVPHGIANAVLLARVSEFSAPAAPERYREIGRALGAPSSATTGVGQDGASAAVEAIGQLCADVRVPPLRELGVPADRFEAVVAQMSRDAIASGSPANNPRVADAAQIEALYRACY